MEMCILSISLSLNVADCNLIGFSLRSKLNIMIAGKKSVTVFKYV